MKPLFNNNNISECGVRNWDCNWKDSKSYYNGRKNTTREGHTCLAWNKAKIDSNPFPHWTHNYCRSKKSDSDPWCYINNQDGLTWEFCEVRDCMECDSGELNSRFN